MYTSDGHRKVPSQPTTRARRRVALSWISSALLTGLVVGCLPLGQIQMNGARLKGLIGGYGDWIGPFYTNRGTTSASTFTAQGTTTTFGPIDWMDGSSMAYYDLAGYYYHESAGAIAQTVASSGTVTVQYIYWDFGLGQPAIPPPNQAIKYVKESVAAMWGTVGDASRISPDAANSAYDGWDDTPTSTDGGLSGGATGIHLVRVDGSSGIISKDITMSAYVKDTVNSSPTASFSSGIQIGITATLDTRGIFIRSSVDESYHRAIDTNGRPFAEVNATEADGTTNADTAIPSVVAPTARVAYTAYPQGGWSPFSSYHWISTKTGYNDNGVFNAGDIIPFRNGLDASNNLYYSPRSEDVTPPNKYVEHVFIRAIDSNQEGGQDVSATANYYLTFHNPIEDWAKTSTTIFPQSISTSTAGWTLLTMIDNNSPAPITQAIGTKKTLTTTMTGEISGKETFDIGALKAFELNEKITVGYTISTEISDVKTFTGAAWTRTSYYGAIGTEHRAGTCSLWNDHGYVGPTDVPWSGVYSNGVVVTAAHLDWTYPGFP
jgi:hypothetical protein